MQIDIVPCLSDNFAYILSCPDTKKAAVIDPSEAKRVHKALESLDVELVAILSTHHHWDHTGGNQELQSAFPALRTYAGADDASKVPGLTDALVDGATFGVGQLEIRALHVPGHTLGAMAYVVGDAVFTGDTLFLAGCGRLFEGTPAMMHRSLNEVLGALPDETRVFNGHEYTQSNLRFAAIAEPGNAAVQERSQRVSALRGSGEWTTGARLSEEHATNPFMRCQSPEIIEVLGRRFPEADLSTPVGVLAALRSWKNDF